MFNIDWIRAAHIVAQIGFYASAFSEILVIVLTTYMIKRKFGPYKHLIVASAAFGLYYASLEFAIYPLVHSKNDGYILFSELRLKGASKQIMEILLVCYAGCFSASISLLSTQFIYRYWAVFCNRKLVYFRSWRIFIWLFLSICFWIHWSSVVYFFCEMDEFSRKMMKTEILDWYGLNIDDIPCFSFVTYNGFKRSPGRTIRWWNIACVVNMTIITIIQYSVMVFCGVRMYLGINENLKTFSRSLQNLHKQFFVTLILQISAPTVTLFIPACFAVYITLFDLELSIPTGALICSMSLYPAFDAFIVMYNVTDYRKALFRVATRFKPSSS